MKNYFQFACELEPIVRFPGCMSKDDLLENLLRQDTQAGFLLPEKRTETALRVMQLEQEAEQRTCEISGRARSAADGFPNGCCSSPCHRWTEKPASSAR